MHTERDEIHWIPGIIGAGLGAAIGYESGELTGAITMSSGLTLAGLLGGKYALNKFLK